MTRQIIFYVVQRMISLKTIGQNRLIQDRPNIRTVKDAMIKPVQYMLTVLLMMQ